MSRIAFQLAGGEYELHFQHHHRQPDGGFKDPTIVQAAPGRVKVVTIAEINLVTKGDTKPTYITQVVGVAGCSKVDNFCKEEGRKLALSRAIQNWDLTKGTYIKDRHPHRHKEALANRQVVWDAYFGRKR